MKKIINKLIADFLAFSLILSSLTAFLIFFQSLPSIAADISINACLPQSTATCGAWGACDAAGYRHRTCNNLCSSWTEDQSCGGGICTPGAVSCGAWSACAGGSQSRSCGNGCSTWTESQSCCVAGVRTCGDWGDCVGGVRSRTCFDGCTTETETQSCCVPGVLVCGAWGACSGGVQSRSCTDGCSSQTQTQSCCLAVVSCGDWGVCVDFRQLRTCSDGCGRTWNEAISCGEEVGCIPGLTNCGDWGSCQNNIQERSCFNNCSRWTETQGCGAAIIQLIISNIFESLAIDTAIIKWETNLDADSLIDYGKTLDYELGSVANPNYVTQHLLAISGLVSDIYYYRITSKTADGKTASYEGRFDLTKFIPPQLPILPKILQPTNIVKTTKQIQKTIKEVINNPEVQKVTEREIAPAVTTIVAINAFASFSLWNLILYLRYLFTEPFFYLFRRKRKWGTVYNSLTKEPVDLAIVRLYNKETGRLIRSRVTDKLGRFNFLVPPAKYYITVTKSNYTFPSVYLKDRKEDIKYRDLYHGEVLEITEKDVLIMVNIPLDPIEETRSVRKIIFQGYLKKIQKILAFSGIPLATVAVFIVPTPITISLLITHLILFWFFWRLAYVKRPKSWGVVYNKQNGEPLKSAIARIYDKEFNKLLETQITDRFGRYSFLVNNNVYYVTAEKNGFKPEKTTAIDLISKDRELIVNLDIGLEKAGWQPVVPEKEAEKEPLPPPPPPTEVSRESLEKLLAAKKKSEAIEKKEPEILPTLGTPPTFKKEILPPSKKPEEEGKAPTIEDLEKRLDILEEQAETIAPEPEKKIGEEKSAAEPPAPPAESPPEKQPEVKELPEEKESGLPQEPPANPPPVNPPSANS